jgi:hypothetical protein
VILECVVDTRGRVPDAKVLRGVPLLEGRARRGAAVGYSITLIDGPPVPVIMTVTVAFRLWYSRAAIVAHGVYAHDDAIVLAGRGEDVGHARGTQNACLPSGTAVGWTGFTPMGL